MCMDFQRSAGPSEKLETKFTLIKSPLAILSESSVMLVSCHIGQFQVKLVEGVKVLLSTSGYYLQMQWIRIQNLEQEAHQDGVASSFVLLSLEDLKCHVVLLSFCPFGSAAVVFWQRWLLYLVTIKTVLGPWFSLFLARVGFSADTIWLIPCITESVVQLGEAYLSDIVTRTGAWIGKTRNLALWWV